MSNTRKTASAADDSTGRSDSADLSLAGGLTLLRELFIKRFRIMLRYRVNFLAQMLASYLFFAVLFFGGQAAVGSVGGNQAITETLDGVIVGWFLYTMAQSAYSSLPGNVTQESEWGTLEQLYMSPYGFGPVMVTKVVVNIFQSFLVGALMLGLILLTTQRTLAIDVLTIVPVTLLALVSVVGIGFVFAGLALVYKRVESVSQLMQFVIVGLIAAPVAGLSPLRFLPLVQGSSMLQDAMRNGVRLWEFPAFDLGILVGVAAVYSLAGYAVFLVCSRVARRRGVMGHY
ncbi:ABC transporter permease [Halorussus litoreus]|uniref:ABC transporter permease n=1 Tax=Halorussus litoreus TaxID=1710536 RepID=UPI001E601D34|nr:ABC transporter permease [Halorussus litoreus]